MQLAGRIFVTITLLAACSAAFSQTATDDQVASATEVGRQIDKALKQAADTGLSGLKLQKAVVKLETGSEVSGGIELNFIIFTITHKRAKGTTQTTELVFQVPQNAGAIIPFQSLTDPLAQAIATAAATAKEINTLPIAEATISIEFAVSRETGGKISFKLLSSSQGGNIDLSKTSRNSLTVTFKQ